MLVIQRSQVSRSENSELTLVTEASDIGIHAMHSYPSVIAIPARGDMSQPCGANRIFRYSHATKDREGDLLFVTYKDSMGTYLLRVYND